MAGPPAELRWEPWFRPANWFWEIFLKKTRLWAIPMPWRCVHVRRDIYSTSPHLEVLRQHERVHYEQMEKDGTIRWHLRYFWWLALKGYRKNPYEVEAYQRYTT